MHIAVALKDDMRDHDSSNDEGNPLSQRQEIGSLTSMLYPRRRPSTKPAKKLALSVNHSISGSVALSIFPFHVHITTMLLTSIFLPEESLYTCAGVEGWLILLTLEVGSYKVNQPIPGCLNSWRFRSACCSSSSECVVVRS